MTQLARVDGVMIGRAAYQNPYALAEWERALLGSATPAPSRFEIVERLLPYIERELTESTPLRAITRHILGLFDGLPGARAWRRQLSEAAHRPGAGQGCAAGCGESGPDSGRMPDRPFASGRRLRRLVEIGGWVAVGGTRCGIHNRRGGFRSDDVVRYWACSACYGTTWPECSLSVRRVEEAGADEDKARAAATAIAGQWEIERRLDQIDRHFDQIDRRIDKIEERLDHLEDRFDRLEDRFDRLENRFDHLEQFVSRLETHVGVIKWMLGFTLAFQPGFPRYRFHSSYHALHESFRQALAARKR